jgi:endogenous inhibitor of DNA gyrase (YacG/DUF329 family)
VPRCPTCKRAVALPPAPGETQDEAARFFPFCNQRCKLADLHGWLNDRYVVSESLPFDEELGLPPGAEDE